MPRLAWPLRGRLTGEIADKKMVLEEGVEPSWAVKPAGF